MPLVPLPSKRGQGDVLLSASQAGRSTRSEFLFPSCYIYLIVLRFIANEKSHGRTELFLPKIVKRFRCHFVFQSKTSLTFCWTVSGSTSRVKQGGERAWSPGA